MHALAGNKDVVVKGLQDIDSRLAGNSQELRDHIAAVGGDGAGNVDSHIAVLQSRIGPTLQQAASEPSHEDAHYVSRFDAVGLFQSVLSDIFSNIPDLQGYGDKNVVWALVPIEKIVHDVSTFWHRVQNIRGQKQSLWSALITELMQLPAMDFRAPFPAGVPDVKPLPEGTPIVLLADWGGDNDAARKVAGVVQQHHATAGIHLGDIYYGGTRQECESFLRLWPFGPNPAEGSSYALNGNHEMYSGGEYYFNLVLPSFKQPQSFFCLENDHWRIIGLDTAYGNSRLKPASPEDPIAPQWNWLLGLLRDKSGRANILLTHHQPVSAHREEWNDSQSFRAEIEEVLSMDGIGGDAIFGWFFGHEHRCAAYKDTETRYNARLIGNGCIPHVMQKENAADPGCTPVAFFNKRETSPGSGVAVSSFAELNFNGPILDITYVDEDNCAWGAEQWNSQSGRLGGVQFIEFDGLTHAAGS